MNKNANIVQKIEKSCTEFAFIRMDTALFYFFVRHVQ